MTEPFDYSENESLERIYHILNGDVLLSSAPSTQGDMPHDEALARITMLLDGTLEGLRNPLDKYGQIWAWTGTTLIAGISATSFTKITGTFQNQSNYLSVTPDWNDDRILVSDSGAVYLIDWSISFVGSPAVGYKFEPFYGGVGIPQAANSATPNTSGTFACASGFGYQYISGSNVAIDLRLLPSITGSWIKPAQVSLGLRRVGVRVNNGTNGS